MFGNDKHRCFQELCPDFTALEVGSPAYEQYLCNQILCLALLIYLQLKQEEYNTLFLDYSNGLFC